MDVRVPVQAVEMPPARGKEDWGNEWVVADAKGYLLLTVTTSMFEDAAERKEFAEAVADAINERAKAKANAEELSLSRAFWRQHEGMGVGGDGDAYAAMRAYYAAHPEALEVKAGE